MTTPRTLDLGSASPNARSHTAAWSRAFVMALALLLGTLIVWTFGLPALASAWTNKDLPTGWLVAAVIVLLGSALIAGYHAYGEPFWGTLLVIAPFLPLVGAAAVAFAYLAPGSRWIHGEALLLGSAVAVGMWVAGGAAFRWMACAKTAQTRSYGELRHRADRLRALLDSMESRKVGGTRPSVTDRLVEARDYSTTLETELDDSGLRFAMATGYVNLWRAIHRAEEALIEIDPSSIVGDAIYDYNRLNGSTIPDAEGLRKEIAAALPDAAALGLLGLARKNGMTNEQSAAVLRGVRRTINEYRDDQWEALIRERNRILRTVLASTLAAYFLLGLAVVCEVQRPALAAVAAYFLTGAVVGLFGRLRAEEQRDSAVDDYGLFEARLVAAAQISGLAGVAGAFLVALAPVLVSAGAPGDTVPNALSAILDLGHDARGLVVAAAFGLTPQLLIDGLAKSSEVIKQNLTSSAAAGSK